MLIYTYKEQVCIKKDHEKFKILDILAVTTQAHEGIETRYHISSAIFQYVTTQAHEGIETRMTCIVNTTGTKHPVPVPGKKV